MYLFQKHQWPIKSHDHFSDIDIDHSKQSFYCDSSILGRKKKLEYEREREIVLWDNSKYTVDVKYQNKNKKQKMSCCF